MSDSKNTSDSLSGQISYPFIASFVHDLKNLMVPVMSRSEMLLLPHLSDEKKQAIAAELHKNCSILLEALNNAVTICRLRANMGEYKPTLFSLDFVVVQAVDFLSETYHYKNINIVTRVAPQLKAWGDSMMITSVIANLLSNALKFTPHGGNVTIQCYPEGEDVRVDVVDSGIGIDPEVIKQLTTGSTFVSTPGTDGERGSGLGLMLCFSQLAKNNSTLEFHNNETGGATFSFRLPAQQS